MAKLTAAARRAIPGKSFALPGRRYPIEDASHARNALARVSQHGSPAEKAEVRTNVHAKYPSMGKAGHMAKAHEHVMAAHRQHTMSAAREHLALAAKHLKSAGANTKAHEKAEKSSQVGGYNWREDERNQ